LNNENREIGWVGNKHFFWEDWLATPFQKGLRARRWPMLFSFVLKISDDRFKSYTILNFVIDEDAPKVKRHCQFRINTIFTSLYATPFFKTGEISQDPLKSATERRTEMNILLFRIFRAKPGKFFVEK
jgi:hypothetical protein